MRAFPAPSSFGDSHPGTRRRICEANPCHDDATGRFTVKGQGRCLGVAARKAARAEYMKRYPSGAPETYPPELYGRPPSGVRGAFAMSELDRYRGIAARTEAERSQKPGVLAPDVKAFRLADEGRLRLTGRGEVKSPKTGAPEEDLPFGRAIPDWQYAEVFWNKGTKRELAAIARHELGHVDRTPLGRGGMSLGRVTLNNPVAEEVRAWKNAIRNSGGRIDLNVVTSTLATYIGANVKQVGDQLRGNWKKQDLQQASEAFVRQHILPVLVRYQRKVRKAYLADKRAARRKGTS